MCVCVWGGWGGVKEVLYCGRNINSKGLFTLQENQTFLGSFDLLKYKINLQNTDADPELLLACECMQEPRGRYSHSLPVPTC